MATNDPCLLLPRSSLGTSDTSSLILLKVISKATRRVQSTHQEASNYEENNEREREVSGGAAAAAAAGAFLPVTCSSPPLAVSGQCIRGDLRASLFGFKQRGVHKGCVLEKE